MKEKYLNLFIDIIKYSLIWGLVFGVITIFVVPFYNYLVGTIGGWVYFIFIVLGVLTKMWISYNSKD